MALPCKAQLAPTLQSKRPMVEKTVSVPWIFELPELDRVIEIAEIDIISEEAAPPHFDAQRMARGTVAPIPLDLDDDSTIRDS